MTELSVHPGPLLGPQLLQLPLGRAPRERRSDDGTECKQKRADAESGLPAPEALFGRAMLFLCWILLWPRHWLRLVAIGSAPLTVAPIEDGDQSDQPANDQGCRELGAHSGMAMQSPVRSSSHACMAISPQNWRPTRAVIVLEPTSVSECIPKLIERSSINVFPSTIRHD